MPLSEWFDSLEGFLFEKNLLMGEEKMSLSVFEPLLPVGGKHYASDYETARADFSWEKIEAQFDWSKTGLVNMAHEAIDRHAQGERAHQIALHYSDEQRENTYTFAELSRLSNQFADSLRKLNIQKGDRVFIFMPRTPELYIALLAILKVGAIVGPLFEAFMEGAVKDRLENSEAVAIVTTPTLLPRIPRVELPALQHVILFGAGKSDAAIEWTDASALSLETQFGQGCVAYEAMLAQGDPNAEITWLSREDGMILHYTSGSTGKPKGVYHVHGAMIQHLFTGQIVLDLQPDDVYWCTADPGWVTGTSYGIFAPWLNGATNVVRGGRFSPHDWYKTIQKYKVTVWYSAPTAFRMLMSSGAEAVKPFDLSSLRHVMSVGEPLNAEVVRWGNEVYGQRIHDTWWMTETGGQLICNYPFMTIKPGSMGKPLPGTDAAIVDDQGNVLPPNTMGNLAIKTGWPSMMRQIWKNPSKYEEYFRLSGWYVSGDSAFMDEEGYFWFQGRVDDVINTSGERVGPFEVESKLVEHPAVAEAGVIGKPDPLRGEIIKAFISLRAGYTPSENLKKEIAQFVKLGLAAHAAPREIDFIEKLPKTRSGKIMRRVLKAQELGLPTGDLSTLED